MLCVYSVSRSSALGSMGDLDESESSSEASEEEDQQDRRPVRPCCMYTCTEYRHSEKYGLSREGYEGEGSEVFGYLAFTPAISHLH